MLFSAFAFILLATLLFRITKSPDFSDKIREALFFLLFADILLVSFAWIQAPKWHSLVVFSLFVVGAFGFGGACVWELFRKYREPGKSLKDLKKQKGPLQEIIAASRLLAQSKLGALMILERRQDLEKWYPKAMPVDAKLSREMLFSIFTPPGAFHDGATIIKKERIICGGLIVPLTKNPALSKELGTRHRAALGFSEVTDALCLVISEETGAISLADRGSLYYDIPFEKLPAYLERGLRFKLDRNKAQGMLLETARI